MLQQQKSGRSRVVDAEVVVVHIATRLLKSSKTFFFETIVGSKIKRDRRLSEAEEVD